MRYFEALFTGWVNAIGTILTIAAILAYIATDIFHKDLLVPAPVALLIGVVAFVIVSARLWSRNALFATAFKESLKDRCDGVILGWEKLAEDYQQSIKREGQSQVLPNPMDPGWVSYGFTVWPYHVGVLQSATISLRRDLARVSIHMEEWNSRISMAQLLNALRKYEKEIANLS
jgi:hypothetical protein